MALAALHDGVLALDRLEPAALAPGDRVLVSVAAGSVGHWLVPLARTAGAVVVGAAGGPEKVAAVGALGADDVLDYREPAWLGGQCRSASSSTAPGARSAARRKPGPGTAARSSPTARRLCVRYHHGRPRVRVVRVEQPIDDATWRRRIREGWRS